MKTVNVNKTILFILVFAQVLFAQGTAGSNAKYEYRTLIDKPTAGILEKGFVGVSLDMLPMGVVISKIEVGVFENFSFGISYGAANLIGTGDPKWYKLPGINVKFKMINERLTVPSITLGFDSQGKGLYFDDLKRYEIKSPGFYVAAAKNFEIFGYLSLHAILNYSLEREDGDKDIDFAVGVEKTLGPQISVIAEYDLASNDNSGAALGEGNGYLNIGVRWSVGSGFTIGMDLRNILDNKKPKEFKAVDRAIFVEYVKGIF